MPEEKGGGDSSRASSSFLEAGDRKIFTVDLRRGETTIVSWKKLIKEANKVNGPSASADPEPPVNVHPSLESRIAPVQAAGSEEDEPAPNRYSAVIEKIERLYMGKDSSDEDLNDIPDDDQYDTEDSFIDDAELDEYFEVDNSAIKHDGFFVNRGTLERIEPTVLPNQQSKKRRRKGLAKGYRENDGGGLSNKQKTVQMEAAMVTSALAKNSITYSQSVVTGGVMKFQNQLNASGVGAERKISDFEMKLDTSFMQISNGDASVTLAEAKGTDRQNMKGILSKDACSKFKDVIVSSDASQLKYNDRSAYAQSKSQSGRPSSNTEEMESTTHARERNGIPLLPDLKTIDGKYTIPTMKNSHINKKDGSSVRPKSSMLEKAIRELEKMVAESRPPALENQEVDNSSQVVKRRLPREIKTKLSRVARLAQASHGKISNELLSRLMSSLGHIIQLRTLKRNLNTMINMGLSAKQEKESRFQQIKKEVVEMIEMRSTSLESKVFERQAGASDNFQEVTADGKGGSKRNFTMDAELEDKFCDLYDLYVDGLDEDTGPQIRKLYAELAVLWPNGLMDNHGIKRAICRAKDRRKALYNINKDQENIRRKKLLTPKMEETVRAEASSNVQTQYMPERLATEPCSHSSLSRQGSSKTEAVRMSRCLSNSADDASAGDGSLTKKKKMKTKPEGDLDETHFRPEKLPSQQGEERHKSLKPTVSHPHKSNLQSSALPSFEQSS